MTDERLTALVWERLDADERTAAWLARQLGMHRQTLHNYMSGTRPYPLHVKEQIIGFLDIRTEEAAA